MPQKNYRVNDTQIVAELFDNEAIIMNLTDGVYFTLTGTGAEVWSLVEAGFDVEAMAQHMAAKHRVAVDQCASDVARLMDDLVDKAIVLPTEDPVEKTAVADIDYGPSAAPELIHHSDMAEVMAMDPPLPELSAPGKPAN
mgnify:CR=1 FL=1